MHTYVLGYMETRDKMPFFTLSFETGSIPKLKACYVSQVDCLLMSEDLLSLSLCH